MVRENATPTELWELVSPGGKAWLELIENGGLGLRGVPTERKVWEGWSRVR